MSNEMRVYGYVNGKPTYSVEEHRYMLRGFGAIESDEELIAFAKKVTGNWYHAGWNRTFETYFLGMDEPYRSLTPAEFKRLKELQKEARMKREAEEAAREWKLKETVYWADNSVEEIWEDKDGNRKTVMTVAPHGDAC